MGITNTAYDKKFSILPSKEFWEIELETPVQHIMSEYNDSNIYQYWINALSDRQLKILFTITQNKKSLDFSMSINDMRQALHDYKITLCNYYLVDYFNYSKLEVSISDIAKDVLHQDILEFCLIKGDKYDKKSLLFLLFAHSPSLLKKIYFYDKIHKKSFASYSLTFKPKQCNNRFSDFVSDRSLLAMLHQYDIENLDDGLISDIQDCFIYKERIYLFIRRSNSNSTIIDNNRLYYKPEWIIMDFDYYGHQVNICSKYPEKGHSIANMIVTKYFAQNLVFKNDFDVNFVKQVESFLHQTLTSTESAIKIFEICFSSNYLNKDTEILITTCPYNSIIDDLQVIQGSTGNILSNVSSVKHIKLMYKNKKLKLSFKYLDNVHDHMQIYYSEHLLDKHSRVLFKSWMKEIYGLKILSDTQY